MKANAPEKLYYAPYGDMRENYPITDNDIEYIRKDAFIEKACKWINKELPITDLSSSNMLDITFKVFDKECKKVFIEEFKKYMKGD